DLGNGVDASGHVVDETPAVVVDDATGGGAPLVVGGTGQRRPADHVTSCVDVADVGTVMLVDADLAPAVDLQADILQPELVGVAGTPVTPEEGIGLDLLAGFEVKDHTAIQPFHALVFFVVTNQYIVVAQVIAERVGYLIIEEAEQLIAVIDEID